MTKYDAFTEILTEELVPALGCTEPIAIAYAAAILRNALKCEPKKTEICLSGNIIKNAKSVIVPATGSMHGIKAAVAAGIISDAPERRLEVLTALSEQDVSVSRRLFRKVIFRLNSSRPTSSLKLKCTEYAVMILPLFI